jgi:aminoglycoside phosphotransferase (APT) family kinase protein
MDRGGWQLMLAAALAERDHRGEILDLARLSGGASRDTWSFDLADGDDRRGLILQRARPGGIRTGVGMSGEAELVQAAGEAGVPVPVVVAWSTEADDIAEAWTVTERLAGESIPRRILRMLENETEAADRLTRQLGEAAAAIHGIDPALVPHLHDEDQVAQFRDLLDAMGQPSPAFELGLAWLEANRPDPVEPAVVHGDLRLGNLIVDEGGLRAVIDWELAHIGDPMEDLAWPCVRAWRFGGHAPVGGFGDRDTFYAAYEAVSGATVERERAHWWEALSTLKWGVMCILQAQTHLGGVTRSVELAAIGRRVCENEYDLLRLTHPHLDDGAEAGPEPESGSSDPGTGLQGRPTATELVEAVREYLRDDVLDATDGRVQYHARVAANALAVVERELRSGPGAERAHAVRLAELGVNDETELAAAIRSGDRDDEVDAVEATVWSAVTAKLAIANPAHLTDD